MRADPRKLDDGTFDLAVVGGGATGAFIAWEAALRGLSVALLEKGDFCAATSFANSRLIDGGLRPYLPRRLAISRELAAERDYWLSAAPYRVKPLGFMLFTGDRRRRYLARARMFIHDHLARRSGLPRGRTVSAREIRNALPFYQQKAGRALLYFDAQAAYPERLVIAALQGAVSRGAKVANYVRAQAIARSSAGLEVRFRDLVSNSAGHLTARQVINATGPWADLLPTPDEQPAFRLERNSGIHLVTPQLSPRFALTSSSPERELFVVPWEEHSLIGTTSEHLTEDPEDYAVDEATIQGLLNDVNAALPGMNVARDDVLFAYGGIRVRVQRNAPAAPDQPCHSEIISHPTPGLCSVFCSAWSVSRLLAERVVDRFCDRPSRSAETPLPGGDLADPDELSREIRSYHPALPLAVVKHLIGLYGGQAEEMLEHYLLDEEPLKTPRPVLAAQARYAAVHEAACHLSDVVFRRTGIGYFGPVSPRALWELGVAMARPLGWSLSRTEREVEMVTAATERFGTHPS